MRIGALTLGAARPKPSQIAVALAAWQRCALGIDTLSLCSAVLIRGALVPVLAARSVIVLVALAVIAKVLALTGAKLAVYFA